MPQQQYRDIVVTVAGKVGTIKFNRPKSLNAFGGQLVPETIAALRVLNAHPDTVFTAITGEGRFFSAGADVRNREGSVLSDGDDGPASAAEKKVANMARLATSYELNRSLIDHAKVLVLALNGPAVGAGAAWFLGSADLVLASTSTYLQVPFSALGLVPEFGSAVSIAQHIGVRRTHDLMMLGRRVEAAEMEAWGLATRVFPAGSFQGDLKRFLDEQLKTNDGGSLLESKRLMNAPLRDGRIVALADAWEALAERFVVGAPDERFKIKKRELEERSKNKAKSKI